MSLANPKILVVEDEPNQVELIEFNLNSEGYEVVVARDGEEALNLAEEENPDLILLDWMLPKVSGIEVCRQLRRSKMTREIPIVMLTARSEESDKIRGLDIGADDYITKPYSIKELLARVRAAMRRPSASVISDQLIVGKIVVDLQKHIVAIDGLQVNLGPTEYRLLVTLMQSPERVFSREQLLDHVWGISANVDTRTVDVHVGRLRKVIEVGANKNIIRTVRGFGYALKAT
ncbi:MAG: phosphate regulon transcriptional regulator PhoB [Paracoccaceae bacterium]|nr:phosphate regulon transcriptional regulator PhoB [Paracoccaceae bacterium]RZO34059.1 MAG: phosphate regulon transcriptional regulatory protein PhoB [Paracoccaceae bacterium]|tara:strand:- start:55 stop:750 length:696 start_codon:yes stop_codon:yes gene_type:complete